MFAWDLSTSYNPDSERMWGDVSSSVNIRPGRSRNLNFRMQNRIDPYSWSLQSTTFSYGFGFDGRIDTGFLGSVREEERREGLDRLDGALPDTAAADTSVLHDQWAEFCEEGETALDDDESGPPDDMAPPLGRGNDQTEGGRYLPFSVSGNVSLNDRRGGDLTSRGSLRLSAQLTRDWSLNYTASFDFRAGETVRQEWRLQRDLHCWRVEFMRTASNLDTEYAFRLHLLAIPELKLTSGRDNMLGTARGMTSGLGMGGF